MEKSNREGLRHKLKIKFSKFAGAISRTGVDSIFSLVGTGSLLSAHVFDSIMKTDGWRGLFLGNSVNVIGVAPSKAIELFARLD